MRGRMVEKGEREYMYYIILKSLLANLFVRFMFEFIHSCSPLHLLLLLLSSSYSSCSLILPLVSLYCVIGCSAQSAHILHAVWKI